MALVTTAALVATGKDALAPPLTMGTPLTERVLARLPGPRLAWLLAWGLSPFVAYEIAYRLWQLPSYAGITQNLTVGVLNLVGLWAAGRLAARVEDSGRHLEGLLEPVDLTPQRHPFRHLGSIRGPLALSLLFVLSWDFLDYLRFPGLANAFTTVTVYFGMTAVATFVWVYGITLIGLDRIGRRRLRLAPFTTDPTLGLKPLGSLAFEAFLLCGLVVLPALLWLLTDFRSAVETLAFVVVVSALFFLSAYTLHRTLVRAKSSQVRFARQRVAVALGPANPVAGGPGNAPAGPEGTDPDAVARLAPSVAVAVEIERRALAIQEWPFDATIVRTVAALATSVTAVIIARFLLSQIGM